VFLAPPGQHAARVELAHDWPSEDGQADRYEGGQSFGRLACEVDDIYAKCADLAETGGLILRPARDGYMAFVRSPDGISVELLQKGE